jgi:hypothetical protein
VSTRANGVGRTLRGWQRRSLGPAPDSTQGITYGPRSVCDMLSPQQSLEDK